MYYVGDDEGMIYRRFSAVKPKGDFQQSCNNWGIFRYAIIFNNTGYSCPASFDEAPHKKTLSSAVA